MIQWVDRGEEMLYNEFIVRGAGEGCGQEPGAGGLTRGRPYARYV